jgi:hypothetical protein
MSLREKNTTYLPVIVNFPVVFRRLWNNSSVFVGGEGDYGNFTVSTKENKSANTVR